MRTKQQFMRMAIGPTKGVSGPIVFSPFKDWDFYYLREPISWKPDPKYGSNHGPVEVPTGFVTDLASIPRPFWSVLSPTAAYAYAAIIHDYLYWTQERPRNNADFVLRIGMEDLEVPAWKVSIIYNAVYWFGEAAWTGNAARKAQGEKRLLRLYPESHKISWEEWRQRPDVFVG